MTIPSPSDQKPGHSHVRWVDEQTIPLLAGGTLLLAFSGWMDGGLVSTGTVRRLLTGVSDVVAHIDPEPFYIYNFPGGMEVTALFRPHVRYERGVIAEFDLPTNTFYCNPARNTAFFLGKEPNLNWQTFGEAIFELVARTGLKRMIFIGSFGGSVPHTREPRLYASISHPKLRKQLRSHGVRFSDYEGPASFATYLLSEAPRRQLEMINLTAEIPGYLEGMNPLSIEAVTRQLGALLTLPVDLDELRQASNEWESQVSSAVEKDTELAATVRQLEESYDNELIGRSVPEADESESDESGNDN